ncbi:MAG: glutathione S-transferase family protein [Halobacteria archaeon]
MSRNMLVEGEWRTDLDETSDGEFVRDESVFRNRIGTQEHPAKEGRYHLYVSRACPWAHGAIMARRILGLTDCITMDVVDPVREDMGWRFSPGKQGCGPDSIHGYSYLMDVYCHSKEDYTGRVTVPVLYDREADVIVNNESVEIIRMLCTEFGDGDLYPEKHRDEIDEVVDELYDGVNNCVYRAGFAESQDAYETAVGELFESLDSWNEELSGKRYLVGGQLTLADLRLFQTLVRFDEVYHNHFRCNVKEITDYGSLWPYLRDLYQTPGIGETVDMSHIKKHYYLSHPGLNPSGIIPVGADPAFNEGHGRESLQG